MPATELVEVEIDLTDIKPIVVITKMTPFVDCFGAKGSISHRETIYTTSQDNALAELIEDTCPVW